MLADLSASAFGEALASDQPAPGGGAAAALTASLAAALVSMVGRHTLGRAKYADVQDRVQVIVAQADGLRSDCLALMDADAAAFHAVSAGYKLDKDDPARPAGIQAGLRRATDVPLAVIRACHQASELAEEIGRIGNQTLRGDALSAGILARAAAQASAINVRGNCAAIEDRRYAEASLSELARLLPEG
jgi:formiminotetrahydrofolate cyclodeaminase